MTLARYGGQVPAMDLGVVAWLTDLDLDIGDLAQMVEQAGLESLFIPEHTHVPVVRRDLLDDPYHARDPRLLDHVVALGAAAAVTSRLKLGTAACVVPQRDPIVLAKQVATLDHISGGRFLFGVAAGWLEEEMRNHGVNPPQRWDIMREHLLAMKEIWTHEEAEFHGEYVDFDPIWMWPKPAQVPHPPILVGGFGPRLLRMTAELGDGWLAIIGDKAEFKRALADLTLACQEVGSLRVEVTACLFEIDEPLLAVCAEHGVARCAIVAPTYDQAALESFLDECTRLSLQFR